MFGNDSLKGILCSCVCLFVCCCFFFFCFVFFCFFFFVFFFFFLLFSFFLHRVFSLDRTLFERLLQTLLSNMTSNVFGFIL